MLPWLPVDWHVVALSQRGHGRDLQDRKQDAQHVGVGVPVVHHQRLAEIVEAETFGERFVIVVGERERVTHPRRALR